MGEIMSQAEIAQKVQDIIAQNLDVDKSSVVPSASFINDLNADSLDIVELVMGIEKEFDLEIPDDEAEKIRTVQDAVDYIVANV
jgi:acyl carrier protein